MGRQTREPGPGAGLRAVDDLDPETGWRWKVGDADTDPVYFPWLVGGRLHGQREDINYAIQSYQAWERDEHGVILEQRAPAVYHRHYVRFGPDSIDIAVYTPREWTHEIRQTDGLAALAALIAEHLGLKPQEHR